MADWKRPDCPPCEVEHHESIENLLPQLLAEIHETHRVLALMPQKSDEAAAAYVRLRNRLEILAVLVCHGLASGEVEPGG